MSNEKRISLAKHDAICKAWEEKLKTEVEVRDKFVRKFTTLKDRATRLAENTTGSPSKNGASSQIDYLQGFNDAAKIIAKNIQEL